MQIIQLLLVHPSFFLKTCQTTGTQDKELPCNFQQCIYTKQIHSSNTNTFLLLVSINLISQLHSVTVKMVCFLSSDTFSTALAEFSIIWSLEKLLCQDQCNQQHIKAINKVKIVRSFIPTFRFIRSSINASSWDILNLWSLISCRSVVYWEAYCSTCTLAFCILYSSKNVAAMTIHSCTQWFTMDNFPFERNFSSLFLQTLPLCHFVGSYQLSQPAVDNTGTDKMQVIS